MSNELDAQLAALIERCDETDRLIADTRRFADLESENAKLREQGERLFDKTLALATENAELRELVRHLRECTRHNVCAACEYADDACDFDYDLRELGIEVDDA
jgi:predicted nuclease with TOPRIM domain